jgi:hypothetical protein
VKVLKKFLSRKQISMYGAIEKQDLVDSVYHWALQLASLENDEMLQSGRRDFEEV